MDMKTVDDRDGGEPRAGGAMAAPSGACDGRDIGADSVELAAGIPDYLRDVYTWAYLDPQACRWLDRQWVVNAILWGNAGRLVMNTIAEVAPGSRVLQLAAVYGNFSRRLAQRVGPRGRLVVCDIAPVQVALTRRKLEGFGSAEVRLADATNPVDGIFDAVVCFFLLHEVPEDTKRRIVRAALQRVARGGKAIFVDYHRPRAWHPLRPVMRLVFRKLEPFADAMWTRSVESYAAAEAGRYAWRRRTLFGGLYQVVVATPVAAA